MEMLLQAVMMLRLLQGVGCEGVGVHWGFIQDGQSSIPGLSLLNWGARHLLHTVPHLSVTCAHLSVVCSYCQLPCTPVSESVTCTLLSLTCAQL